jgi:hypothetical protein
MPKIVGLFFNKSQISPDGSKTSSSVILSTMKSMAIPISSRCFLLSSGARPVLPMVVALEAIVESFSSIGSSVLLSQLHRSCIDFVGCATSTPDGSSPRGLAEFFCSSIGSKIFSPFYSFVVISCKRFLVSSPRGYEWVPLETIIVSGLVCLTYNLVDFTRYS